MMLCREGGWGGEVYTAADTLTHSSPKQSSSHKCCSLGNVDDEDDVRHYPAFVGRHISAQKQKKSGQADTASVFPDEVASWTHTALVFELQNNCNEFRHV